MKALQSTALMICLLFLTGCLGGLGKSNFEGEWICKDNNSDETMKITNIAKNTYELSFGEDISFSGEVNDDGVLVVEMMGNVSRLFIDDGELHFSGILAPCKDFIKA